MHFTESQVKARLISQKIKPSFSEANQGALMFAIVDMAIMDRFSPEPDNEKDIAEHLEAVETAKDYLSGRMIHCELAGVSAEWVRSIIDEVNSFSIGQVVTCNDSGARHVEYSVYKDNKLIEVVK